MPDFTQQEKLNAVLRELRMRRNVYPGLIARGKMTQADADEQIAVMEAIAEDYKPADLFSREGG